MFKIILKRALILSLPILSVHAQTGPSKESLANQCDELSRTISLLVSNQEKKVCIDKLHLASIKMSAAGSSILEGSTAAARQTLDDAVLSLQYAELNSCNNYIQISHAKFEAHKIKTAILSKDRA